MLWKLNYCATREKRRTQKQETKAVCERDGASGESAVGAKVQLELRKSHRGQLGTEKAEQSKAERTTKWKGAKCKAKKLNGANNKK